LTIIRTKRSMAPGFWRVPRKGKRYVITALPGPHSKLQSYPLATLLRDILQLTRTYRESKAVIHDGKILVDRRIRRGPDFPVGLMDLVEIPAMGKSYRILPSKGSLLPVAVADSEKDVKICKVTGKRIIAGGAVQYALHDGRNVLTKDLRDINPGDSLLIQVPSQKVLSHIRFHTGSLGLISKGQMAGKLGKILTSKPSTFSRPSMTELSFDSEVFEIPSELVFPIGTDKPMITIEAS